jgi:hypothetical protein
VKCVRLELRMNRNAGKIEFLGCADVHGTIAKPPRIAMAFTGI